MTILTILSWVVTNRNSLFKAILSLVAAFLIGWCVTLHKDNKKLSEGLEMAQNNIEAYLDFLAGSLLANNVLRLDIETLQQQHDKTLHKLDSVRKLLNIKTSQINTAATQTQSINVKDSKGVGGNLIEILKDTVYNDSIKYNDLTTVKYTIGTDTVSIELNIENTLYLYIYTKKEYKNKKSFIKRLLTLDFKKEKKERYEIVNTNDLLKSEDVRIIKSNN